MKQSGDRVIGSSGHRDERLPATIFVAQRQKEFAFLRDVARRLARRIQVASRIIVSTLREIFDENAYERFLRQNNAVRSVASYKAFLQARESWAARRPRCC